MNILVEKERVKLPDFFVVGAAKGATTSLHALLSQHPNIFLPEQKELYTFAFNGETPRFKLADGTPREKVGCTWNRYFKIYDNCPENCLAGDTSSWYLRYHKAVITNIRRLYGESSEKIKIIMVLRNPVERAWSHYSMHLGQGLIDLPFRDTITGGEFRKRIADAEAGYYPGYDYIGFGMYSGQVQAFLDAFGQDNVKVFLYEEFQKDNLTMVNEVFRFLGLEPAEQIKTGKKLNISGTPKSGLAETIGKLVYRPFFLKRIFRSILPAGLRYKFKRNISRFLFKKTDMKNEDRSILIDIYREDIDKLQMLLNKDLSTWLKI